MPNDNLIVSVVGGDPEECKIAGDLLLHEHGIYIRPVKYPTVPQGNRAASHHARQNETMPCLKW